MATEGITQRKQERESTRIPAKKETEGKDEHDAHTSVAEIASNVALGPRQRDLIHPRVHALQLVVVHYSCPLALWVPSLLATYYFFRPGQRARSTAQPAGAKERRKEL